MGNSISEDRRPIYTRFPHNLEILFNLASNDVFIDNYLCALYDDIPIQGQLFILPNCLLFHSIFNKKTLLGDTKLRIEYSDITSLDKAKSYFGLNNSMHIDTRHQQHKFTSFLFRDQCFELIQKTLWNQDSQDILATSFDLDNHVTTTSQENKFLLDSTEYIKQEENYIEKLSKRREKLSEAFHHFDKFNISIFKFVIPNSNLQQCFRVFFGNIPLKIKEENFSNWWEIISKRSGIPELPIVEPWNQTPPDLNNPEELANLDYDYHLQRKIKSKKVIKGPGAFITGKYIDYEEIQKLYILSDKELIITSHIKFLSKVPFSDTFEFQNCWMLTQMEGDLVNFESRYYLNFVKSTFMKGMIERNSKEEYKDFGIILEGILHDIKESGILYI